MFVSSDLLSLSDSVSYLEQNVVLIKKEKKNRKLKQQGSGLNNYSNEKQMSALKIESTSIETSGRALENSCFCFLLFEAKMM